MPSGEKWAGMGLDPISFRLTGNRYKEATESSLLSHYRFQHMTSVSTVVLSRTGRSLSVRLYVTRGSRYRMRKSGIGEVAENRGYWEVGWRRVEDPHALRL